MSNLDWEGPIADKELLVAVKHVMQGNCLDIVSQLSGTEGDFELLRLLALKFDPVMPNLYQMLMASIYGLANDKCKDFRATVARVAHIERVSNDMADRCGQRPTELILVGVFRPSMDHTSITDLVHYRTGTCAEARPVHTDCYAELREYVRLRDARERVLAPIPAKRMEVGSCAEQYHQQQEQQPKIPFPEINPSWGEPWTQVGHCQGQENSLFAFGKGGKKGYEKKPLGCHNCGGLGHPSHLCTSEQ